MLILRGFFNRFLILVHLNPLRGYFFITLGDYIMRIGYIRISNEEPTEECQREALKQFMIERWYVDEASVQDMNRPVLQEMLRFVRDEDVLYVYDLSRFALSTFDLVNVTNVLKRKEVNLVSYKESLDTTSPDCNALSMVKVIAEFERYAFLESPEKIIKLVNIRESKRNNKLK